VIAKKVIINPKPSPGIYGDTSVCQNDTGLVYQSTTPVGGDNYKWMVKGGVIRAGTNKSFAIVDWHYPGTGSIWLTQTNRSGCDTTIGLLVNIHPKPLPFITGPGKACEYSGNNIYTTPGVAGESFQWEVVAGNIISGDGTNSINVQWEKAGLGLVTLREKNANGCDTVIYKPVTIEPRPASAITGPVSACPYNAASVFSTVMVPGSRYYWKVTGGTIISGSGTNSIVVRSGGPGTAKITLTEINALGCDTTVSIAFIINPNPVTSIAGPDSVCKNATKIYDAVTDPSASYSWNITGGTFKTGNSPGQVIITWGDAGTGHITLTQTNAYGCDTTISKDITIKALMVPVISGRDNLCAFENDVQYSVNYIAGYQYLWTVTGGEIAGDPSSNEIIVNWKNSGIGIVQIKQSSSLGCDTTVQKKVNIASFPDPVINGFLKVCEKRGGYIYETVPEKDVKYLWALYGGTIVTDSGSKISVLWDAAGSGMVILNVVNGFGCTRMVSINVSIEKHSPKISGLPATFCTPAQVEFSYPPDNNIVYNTWDFGDGSTSDNPKTTHRYMIAGNYKIRLITQNSLGCTDTTYSSVKIFTSPKAGFDIKFPTAEKVLYDKEDFLLLTNTSKFGRRYLWDFGDGTMDENFEPLPHMYHLPGQYYIKQYVWNDQGCKDSMIYLLNVETHIRIFIPNAFTPSNSKVNTYFWVSTYNLVNFRILIYNRWGENVYESRDLNFKWDGTFKGSIVPIDVYIYLITAKDLLDRDVKRKGQITILR
jgi:gliding motility-associated-like protein